MNGNHRQLAHFFTPARRERALIGARAQSIAATESAPNRAIALATKSVCFISDSESRVGRQGAGGMRPAPFAVFTLWRGFSIANCQKLQVEARDFERPSVSFDSVSSRGGQLYKKGKKR